MGRAYREAAAARDKGNVRGQTPADEVLVQFQDAVE